MPLSTWPSEPILGRPGGAGHVASPRRARLRPIADVPSARQLELAGEWAKARKPGSIGLPLRGCPGHSGWQEEEPLRMALDELQSLDARPAAAIIARRSRPGALSLPRRRAQLLAKTNSAWPGGSSTMLALVNVGSPNREIADQLVLFIRTSTITWSPLSASFGCVPAPRHGRPPRCLAFRATGAKRSPHGADGAYVPPELPRSSQTDERFVAARATDKRR